MSCKLAIPTPLHLYLQASKPDQLPCWQHSSRQECTCVTAHDFDPLASMPQYVHNPPAGRRKRVDHVDHSFQPGVSNGLAPVAFAPRHQQRPQEHAQQPQAALASRVQALFSSLKGSGTSTVWSNPDADLPNRRSLQAVSAQVDPSWPTAVGVVKFRDGQRRVPEHFLATSHEWTRIVDYGGESAAAWAEIFKSLGPSPVLRIGGATQDKLVDPPKDETWAALAQVQKLTNAR